MENGAVLGCLVVLLGMAELKIKWGEYPGALEYLALVVNHPAADREAIDKAEALLVEVGEVVSEAVIEAARVRMADSYIPALMRISEEILKPELEA